MVTVNLFRGKTEALWSVQFHTLLSSTQEKGATLLDEEPEAFVCDIMEQYRRKLRDIVLDNKQFDKASQYASEWYQSVEPDKLQKARRSGFH